MKNIKLYNVIFPLWALFCIPPILYFVLVGNFIIDGTVIWVALLLNKIKLKKSILLIKIIQEWCFGLLVDFLGTLFIDMLTMNVGLVSEYITWENFVSVLLFLSTVLVCGLIISVINYKLFKKDIMDKRIRFRIGLAMGIITAPWTFLIPAIWFY
ncbi:MAG: hypothetical protein ACM3YE_16390 [Bacteroidota bacterium]